MRDVTIVEWAEALESEIEIQERVLPYCVVVSQECDLEHDFNNRNDPEKSASSNDKYLQSILVCPAYLGAELREGTHLSSVGLRMQRLNSGEWKRVVQNQNYRYHVLPEEPEAQIPELAIDFKHYLTIPRDIAYRAETRTRVIASLDDLFREHLSSRFAHYLSRIGLPELESA